MPAEVPLPSVNRSNPIPLYFEMLPEGFVVSKTIYDDGGADYKLQVGGVGVRTWIIRYDGLFPAEAAILDAWVASMFYSEDEGSAYGANLRHHIAGEAWTSTNGTLYANVHIKAGGYKTSHSQAVILARELILEQRP
jgi:hypothetical protein